MILQPAKLKRRQGGFTLLELLVVFSIIGVLAGVGFAAFNNYSRSQVLDQAVQEVKIAIEKTKFNAVSSVKPSGCDSTKILNRYEIIFTPATSSYTINAICESVTIQISTKSFPNVTMVTTGSPPITTCATLSYNTLTGFENAVACRVVMSAYGRTKSIEIDAGGNASIQ